MGGLFTGLCNLFNDGWNDGMVLGTGVMYEESAVDKYICGGKGDY